MSDVDLDELLKRCDRAAALGECSIFVDRGTIRALVARVRELEERVGDAVALLDKQAAPAQPEKCGTCGSTNKAVRWLLSFGGRWHEPKQACDRSPCKPCTDAWHGTGDGAQERDALDGQAALDEANNEIVRLKAELEAVKAERDALISDSAPLVNLVAALKALGEKP